MQFVQDVYSHDFDPTIEDNYRRYITVDGEEVLLDVLDTADGSEFNALRDHFVLRSDLFMYIVSVDDANSLCHMAHNLQSILRQKKLSRFPVLVIGINKIDLDESMHVVTEQMVTDILRNLPIHDYAIFKMSAKARINVHEAFEELLRIYKSKRISHDQMMNMVLKVLKKDKKVLNIEGKKKCNLM